MNAEDEERHVPAREQELSQIKGKGKMFVEESEESEDEQEKPVYDIVEQKRLEQKQKKRDDKEMKSMAKGVMTSKNRNLMKAIEMSKAKGKRENNRLSAKAKRS